MWWIANDLINKSCDHMWKFIFPGRLIIIFQIEEQQCDLLKPIDSTISYVVFNSRSLTPPLFPEYDYSPKYTWHDGHNVGLSFQVQYRPGPVIGPRTGCVLRELSSPLVPIKLQLSEQLVIEWYFAHMCYFTWIYFARVHCTSIDNK